MKNSLTSLCFLLALSVSPCAVAVTTSNNNFASAYTYAGASDKAFETATATRETGEPSHLEFAVTGGHSVWWKFTPPLTGLYQIDTSGSDYNTALSVYTGTAVAKLTRIAANDNVPYVQGATTSQLRVLLTKGVTYRIAVDGRTAAEGGTATLHVQLLRYFTPGTYLVYVEGGESSVDGGGIVSMTLANTGVITGKFLLGARSYAFTTIMAADGSFTATANRPGLLPASLSTTMGSTAFTFPDGMPGAATNKNSICNLVIGGISSPSFVVPAAPGDAALRPYFPGNVAYTAAAPCPRAGRYPFTIPQVVPQTGYAVAALSVGATGAVTGSGKLGDGTAFTFACPLLNDQGTGLNGIGSGGLFIFNAPLYAGKGRLTAIAGISGSATPAIVSGNGIWMRPAVPGAALFADGIVTAVNLRGSRYAAPTTANKRVDAAFDPTGELNFSAAHPVFTTVNKSVTLSSKNVFSIPLPNPAAVKLTLAPATGMISGSLKFSGSPVVSPVSAVLIHHPQLGTGFFGGHFGAVGYGPVTILLPQN